MRVEQVLGNRLLLPEQRVRLTRRAGGDRTALRQRGEDDEQTQDLHRERLGAPWVGERVRRDVETRLGDPIDDRLHRFYVALRACLRARPAMSRSLLNA